MSPVNPLVTLRESAGLTVTELSEYADLSLGAVIRAEQGVYTSPSQVLLDALWRRAPEDDLHDYGILLAEYHNFQELTRRSNYGALDTKFDFADCVDTTPATHPFLQWRIDSEIEARIQISKLFCVHPALIFKFEAQPWLCATIPKDLLYALQQSGYDSDLLESFAAAYAVYKVNRRGTHDKS